MDAGTVIKFGALAAAISVVAYVVYRLVRKRLARPAVALPAVTPLATAPSGAAIAYDMAREQLKEQLKSLTDIDSKLGVAIGALVALVAGFVAAPLPAPVRALGGVWIGVALVQAIRAFFFGKYRYAPEHAGPKAHATEASDAIKWAAFLAIGLAIDQNEAKLFRKGFLLNQVVVTIGLIVGLVLIARTFDLI